MHEPLAVKKWVIVYVKVDERVCLIESTSVCIEQAFNTIIIYYKNLIELKLMFLFDEIYTVSCT